MGKTNVIIIMADQLRYDALGSHTPNINSIRNESVTFDNAYCASPLCVPARGAFFTGKYPNVTGSLHNAKVSEEKENGTVKKEHTNLYEIMEEDWDSWHTGKMDFRTEEKIENNFNSKTNWFPLEPRYYQHLDKKGKKRPGGEHFRGVVPQLIHGNETYASVMSTPKTGCFNERIDDFYDGFILNDTLSAIENRKKSKPFLLNAMFFAPHPPLDIPEPWFSAIQEVDLPKNVGVWGSNQSPLQLYNLTGIMGANKSRNDWEEPWRVYTGFVSLLDYCIGRVIENLKSEGIYDDSLIIFTSDHGEMLGSHRLWQKMCLYQEAIKTPLFMKFPRSEGRMSTNIQTNVSSVDILPTICDYLNLTEPSNCSGISLMPLLKGEKLQRRSIYIQYDGNASSSNFSRCVMMSDYKLIVDLFKDELFMELYNVSDDPQEMENLSFERANAYIVENMLRSLRQHMKETNDSQIIPEDAYTYFLNVYERMKS